MSVLRHTFLFSFSITFPHYTFPFLLFHYDSSSTCFSFLISSLLLSFISLFLFPFPFSFPHFPLLSFISLSHLQSHPNSSITFSFPRYCHRRPSLHFSFSYVVIIFTSYIPFLIGHHSLSLHLPFSSPVITPPFFHHITLQTNFFLSFFFFLFFIPASI